MHNLHVAYTSNLCQTYKTIQIFGTFLSYDNVYQRTVACALRIENVSLTYSACTPTYLVNFHTSSYVGANVP